MSQLLHSLQLNFNPWKIFLLCLLTYLIFQLVPKIVGEFRLFQCFRKLPKLPVIGPVGWIVGNVDIYYYAMRHLPLAQGALQVLNSLHQIESLRNHGFIRMNIGFQKVVVFFRSDTVESLVSNTVNISKSEQYDWMKPWLGSGLLTSSGSHWKHHRKALTPAFHFKVLESFGPIMNSNVQVMLKRIEAQAHNEIDIRHFITDLALDIICETAMGTTVGAQSENDDKEAYRKPIEIATAQLMGRFINPIYQSDLIYNLSPDGRENARTMAKIHQFVKKVIDERKETLQKNMQNGKKETSRAEESMAKEKHPFLDSLLLTHFKNPLEFTETDILDEVNTFMVAGHDTTAEGMIFALMLIASDARVQNAIAAELDELFAGEADDCEITTEHCRQMKYLEMAIKEALRLYTPVPSAARKVEQDFSVNGHIVPAGCIAVVFINLLHRDPKVFPQPERFIPERFDADSPVNKSSYAYIPFSAGPRNCIGQKFAMLEMKIVLASILKKYQLTAVTARDDIKLDFGSVLTATSPVVIRFCNRQETDNITC